MAPEHLKNGDELACNRRGFLRWTTVSLAATAMTSRNVSAASPGKLKIDEPFDGAVFNNRQGKLSSGGLTIRVAGTAPIGTEVKINGRPAQREGTKFIGEAVLSQKVTKIVAEAKDCEPALTRVVWDKFSEPRYHFALDDNIFFLRDIAHKGYKSLFDCFYLKLLRDLHKKYGTCFSANIYYEAGDGFTLAEFPDRYMSEWKDNAHWLKLAFHAYADKPDRPYQEAPAEKLIADYDKVGEQIYRFAGEESFAPPTNLHWAMATQEGLNALGKRGVRVLSGYFRPSGGRYDINYNFDATISEYVLKNNLWMDFESGIIFTLDAIVCNGTPVDRVAPTLDPFVEGPNQRDTVNLLTHEQYFWPFYKAHVPDHANRCETAIRWATDHGYKPVFFHEGLLGGREAE